MMKRGCLSVTTYIERYSENTNQCSKIRKTNKKDIIIKEKNTVVIVCGGLCRKLKGIYRRSLEVIRVHWDWQL